MSELFSVLAIIVAVFFFVFGVSDTVKGWQGFVCTELSDVREAGKEVECYQWTLEKKYRETPKPLGGE